MEDEENWMTKCDPDTDLPGLTDPEQFTPPTVVVPENPADDANVAREGYHKVLARAQTASDQLHNQAFIAQHPRFYEVLAQLMRVELEAADRLREGVKDLQPQGPKEVHNTLVLNSTEILDLVKKQLKK